MKINLEERYNKLLAYSKDLEHDIESMNQIFNKYVITSKTDSKGIITDVSEPYS